MIKRLRCLFLLVFLATFNPALASDTSSGGDEHYFFAGPGGAWVVDVEFPFVDGAPPPPPPFKEILTFHALGTVSETNTLLNESSYVPGLGQGCGFTGPGGLLELNCNGGDGYGTWRRTGRNTLSFVFVKLVFDGQNNHVGYLRVTANRMKFHGNRLEQSARHGLTEFLVGTDIAAAVAIPLGGADSSGTRIR
ncbi:MAG: hypothetical protein AAF438_13250 [Pseudomonadota bacterium]